MPLVALLLLSIGPEQILGNPSPAVFVESAESAGLVFRQHNGSSGQYYFPEIVGAGVAVFDFDNDGDLDVYLVQGGTLGPDGPVNDGPDQLFENKIIPGGKLQFVNITDTSGIVASGYGMGVAVGDYDRDGWLDLYISNLGPDQLLRNAGDGTFTDATASAGIKASGWSTSTTFSDLDRDGWQDLFVASYVAYSTQDNISCYAPSSRRDYCGPASFAAVTDRLMINLANGTFVDATVAMLGSHEPKPGLGAVARDFDGDGWKDIYVANDGAHNQLWISQAGERFTDGALFAGSAVNNLGRAEASMGVAVADADRDGDQDLFLTHLTGESNTLYLNDGSGNFTDRTASMGLASGSMRYTGWGTGWVDLNRDGWQDLIVVNGAVTLIEGQTQQGAAYPFKQSNQAFLNLNGTGFRDVSGELGEDFKRRESSRGMALGDLDNDGDLDIVINDSNAAAKLLLNQPQHSGRWIGIALRDRDRPAIGSRVGLQLKDGATRWQVIARDGSYASSKDSRALYCLTPADQPTGVVVIWPHGMQTLHRLADLNQYQTINMPSTTDQGQP